MNRNGEPEIFSPIFLNHLACSNWTALLKRPSNWVQFPRSLL